MFLSIRISSETGSVFIFDANVSLYADVLPQPPPLLIYWIPDFIVQLHLLNDQILKNKLKFFDNAKKYVTFWTKIKFKIILSFEFHLTKVDFSKKPTGAFEIFFFFLNSHLSPFLKFRSVFPPCHSCLIFQPIVNLFFWAVITPSPLTPRIVQLRLS